METVLKKRRKCRHCDITGRENFTIKSGRVLENICTYCYYNTGMVSVTDEQLNIIEKMLYDRYPTREIGSVVNLPSHAVTWRAKEFGFQIGPKKCRHCGTTENLKVDSLGKVYEACEECYYIVVEKRKKNTKPMSQWNFSAEGKKCKHCGTTNDLLTGKFGMVFNICRKCKSKLTSIQSLEMYAKKTPEEEALRINRIRVTKMERYGNPKYNNISKNRETCRRKYGVDNPAQIPEVYSKCHEYMRKDYRFPSGKIVKVQGYEPFVLDWLLRNNYKEEDIVVGAKNVPLFWYKNGDGSKHRYFPDIFIPKDNLIIEVKCGYTYEEFYEANHLKKQACLDEGYNFWFAIAESETEIEFKKFEGE